MRITIVLVILCTSNTKKFVILQKINTIVINQSCIDNTRLLENYKKLQKFDTNVGATNEQTNENKVQCKNKTKFLY